MTAATAVRLPRLSYWLQGRSYVVFPDHSGNQLPTLDDDDDDDGGGAFVSRGGPPTGGEGVP